MLGDNRAFSSFAVDDLGQAHAFYGETLGVQVTKEEMGILTLHLEGGARPTMVYPKPDYAPATYTVLNFAVDNVEQAVDALAARGVRFERYDGFEQDDKGIARDEGGPPIAWFKDPAGNILAVLEQ
jgi:catechol 2,3-dioxygenase-like lactoylglutathione lyase family enzyme